MKRIFFNDKFDFTNDVIHGNKTQVRMIIPQNILKKYDDYCSFCDTANSYGTPAKKPILEDFSSFKVGEVVAVAQSYFDIYMSIPEQSRDHNLKILSHQKGWLEKRCIKSEYMPHQIRITNVRAEHLQDISDEDCLAEGIFKKPFPFSNSKEVYVIFQGEGKFTYYDSPRIAYSKIIDKIVKKGTWKNNPLVYAYNFELIK